MPSASTWDPSCQAPCDKRPAAMAGFLFLLERWLARAWRRRYGASLNIPGATPKQPSA